MKANTHSLFSFGSVSALLLLLGAALPVTGQSFHGSYRLDGVDLEGNPYKGVAAIEPVNMHSKMTWTVEGDPEAEGLVVAHRGAFVMAYGGKNLAATAVYSVDKGRLRGVFSAPGMQGMVGLQELQGPEELGGTYRDPEDPASKDAIVFKPAGKGRFEVTWTQANRVYKGIAVRHGDFLGVTYAENPEDLVLSTLYIPTEKVWDGKWVTNIAPGVGKATLTPSKGPLALPTETPLLVLFGGQGWQRTKAQNDPDGMIQKVRAYVPVFEKAGERGSAKNLTLVQHASPLPNAKTLMKQILDHVDKLPNSETHSHVMEADKAVALMLTRPASGKVILEIVSISGKPGSYRMVQFTLENKGAYAEDEAFVQEQKRRMNL